tara:strand:+ start:10836 stop:11549 length:714 start_codon:yes stop_codon:yes gene_type:complete
MARKKGVIKQISNYGEKHPYVTLALAGTFGYYLYDMIKVQSVAPLTERQKVRQDVLATGDYTDHILRERMKTAGLGATTSTSTTSSSSHRMPGPGDGETSMYIDPTKSGMFGLGATVKAMPQTDMYLNQQTVTRAVSNPPAHLMFDKAQGLGACNNCGTRSNPHCHCGGSHGMNGFSPSARRRIGHAGIGMASESYEATLDTQFENREAMMMGDLKKHQDILGFSGLAPLAGGDWYE